MDTIYLVLIIVANPGHMGFNVTAMPSYETCEQVAQMAMAESIPGLDSAVACVTRRDLEKSIRQYSCALMGSDGHALPGFIYTCYKGHK